MNRHILLLALFMTVIIPGILFQRVASREEGAVPTESVPQLQSEYPSVRVLVDGNVVQMELEAYVECVILGEIPADFEDEMLKAQAVATRTYALKCIQRQKDHADACLCADPSCCQAFTPADAFLRAGGSQVYIDRVQAAVRKTAGEVLLYDGKLIEATYFSASGGRTEAAVEVWGTEIPYLKSVDSLSEQAEKYENRKWQFTQEEFLEKLDLPMEYAGKIICTDISYTAGNGIKTITVCGRVFTGIQIREYLQLPSTVFEIVVSASCVNVYTDGNGHRVGMSQYGADAMAAAGSDYRQILSHYYPGTDLKKLSTEEIKGIFDKAGNL